MFWSLLPELQDKNLKLTENVAGLLLVCEQACVCVLWRVLILQTFVVEHCNNHYSTASDPFLHLTVLERCLVRALFRSAFPEAACCASGSLEFTSLQRSVTDTKDRKALPISFVNRIVSNCGLLHSKVCAWWFSFFSFGPLKRFLKDNFFGKMLLQLNASTRQPYPGSFKFRCIFKHCFIIHTTLL